MIARRASRRGFIRGGLALAGAVAVVRAPARAARFEFKSGSSLAVDHPSNVRLTQMWAAIERESGGRVHASHFPNDALGSETSMLTQLRVGGLDFALLGSPYLDAVVPVADITSLGFAFAGSDEAWRCIDGPVGAYVRQESAAKGIYVFRSIFDSGIFQLACTGRSIHVPEDLHGLKIKTAGKISIDLFKSLGATPVALNVNETYTALQTKLVDGNSSPLVTLETSRFYEVARYISLTNHSWSGLWYLANLENWRRLPADIQSVIERNQVAYAVLERRDSKILALSVADKLARQGAIITTVDQAPFRARLGTYYKAWAATFGPKLWDLLETSLGRSLAFGRGTRGTRSARGFRGNAA